MDGEVVRLPYGAAEARSTADVAAGSRAALCEDGRPEAITFSPARVLSQAGVNISSPPRVRFVRGTVAQKSSARHGG